MVKVKSNEIEIAKLSREDREIIANMGVLIRLDVLEQDVDMIESLDEANSFTESEGI